MLRTHQANGPRNQGINMTITTVPLEELTLVLRKPFAPIESGGAPVADKHGQQIFMAQAAAPGEVRFGLDDTPSEIRLKVVGVQPTMPEGSLITITGGKLTTWYNRGQRGAQSRSDVTISAETVQLARPGSVPMVRGGLPAHHEGNTALLIGVNRDGNDNPIGIDVMFDATGTFAVNGVCQIRCTAAVPTDYIMRHVVIHDLRAYFSRPSAEDVGQRTKTELILGAAHVTPLEQPASNGRRPKDVQPDPEPAPVG
jgi:hypothetical protein